MPQKIKISLYCLLPSYFRKRYWSFATIDFPFGLNQHRWAFCGSIRDLLDFLENDRICWIIKISVTKWSRKSHIGFLGCSVGFACGTYGCYRTRSRMHGIGTLKKGSSLLGGGSLVEESKGESRLASRKIPQVNLSLFTLKKMKSKIFQSSIYEF